jgi:hypothetical protein
MEIGHGQAVFKGEGTVTCYSYTVTVTGYSSLNSNSTTVYTGV